MLIRDDGDTWTAITQPAHAYLAGQLARHWTPTPHADVVLGIEQHDVSWWDWDRTPPLHAEAGRAAAFFESPLDKRLEIWTNVARHLEAQSPYAAILVALHSTNIHTRYLPEEQRPQAVLASARADQDRLLALLPDATREQAEADADLLFALDQASLVLCNGWEGRELPPVQGRVITITPTGDTTATLDPWPLGAETVTVSTVARVLTERFSDEASLHAGLDATPYTTLSWTLTPAAS